MSDFASEVASAKPGKSMPAPAPIMQGGPMDEPAAQAETLAQPETATETKTSVEATPAPKKTTIKIGDEVFESAEEAIQYATQLQMELAKKDAYELGKQAAQPKAEPQAPVKDEFDELGDQIFENPKEALKKLSALAEERAEKRIREAQAREQAIQKTWEGFYSQNQDLVENKDLVDFVLQKNWSEIGNLPVEKSLKILAEKTRSLLSSRKISALPTQELPSAPAVTTTATSSATTVVKEKEENPVDFISQINKHRKRG